MQGVRTVQPPAEGPRTPGAKRPGGVPLKPRMIAMRCIRGAARRQVAFSSACASVPTCVQNPVELQYAPVLGRRATRRWSVGRKASPLPPLPTIRFANRSTLPRVRHPFRNGRSPTACRQRFMAAIRMSGIPACAASRGDGLHYWRSWKICQGQFRVFSPAAIKRHGR
jgi:hypothetical protein